MCFIHSRLSRLRFALRRDIVDHRDIQLLFFFNRGRCQFLMNVYLDDRHTAVDFLSNTAPNIPHLLYMGGDFNVRDAEWDPSVSSHPAAGQALMDLADSYRLVRSIPALSVPTHYSDISSHANSVIDLIFLGMSCAQVFFFFLNHQFVTRCSIAVCGRLSTTSSLQYWPQETKTPLIGIETQLESIEFKEKSK